MDSRQLNRRRLLGAVGATATAALAGCLQFTDNIPLVGRTDDANDGEIVEDPDGPKPVLADESLYVGHSAETLRSAATGGGPGVDGIPSIDDPSFESADESDLDDDHPVFGVVRNGVAKAYPQYVLVWHEIVNDTFGDEPVAVTYCPLTGTAQGFGRGETTFGVSGDLVNSNLIMYDRGTGTRWPQIAATGTQGPFEGESLTEFRVIWTTWDNWREAHPDTDVLTSDTGYQRRYGNDPYGEYAPPSDYYADDRLIFEPLETTDDEHPKEVVIGARTTDGAIAFNKERLLDESVLQGETDEAAFVAVADPDLETGYVYRQNGASVDPAGDGQYTVDGETASAADLPLDRRIAFDGMFFAWYGLYPGLTYVD